MNTIAIVGLILIVLGAIGLIYEVTITYTSKKEDVHVGPIEIQTERKEQIPLSPLLGGTAVIVGIILVILGQRRSGRRPIA